MKCIWKIIGRIRECFSHCLIFFFPKKYKEVLQSQITEINDETLQANEDLVKKKALILDLDETLVFSSFEKLANADFVLELKTDQEKQEIIKIYVKERPGLREFLSSMHEFFDIVVYTASKKEYAEAVISHFDKNNYISKRFFRESCIYNGAYFTKDISILNLDPKDIIIIDNSPLAFELTLENALHIPSYQEDKEDDELDKIKNFLLFLKDVEDVRPIEKWGKIYNSMMNSSNSNECSPKINTDQVFFSEDSLQNIDCAEEENENMEEKKIVSLENVSSTNSLTSTMPTLVIGSDIQNL